MGGMRKADTGWQLGQEGKNGGIPETLKRRQKFGGESHVGVERTPPLSLAEKKNWVEAGRECLREKSELDSRHAEFPVPTRVCKQVVSKATTHQQRRERELGSWAPRMG